MEEKMILSVTLSKPAGNVQEKLGRPYQKIKIKLVNTADGALYQEEMFTKTQVFHNKITEKELSDFLDANIGVTFKNCVKRTESEEITLLTNKKGKITELRKPVVEPVETTGLKVLPAGGFEKLNHHNNL